MAKDFNPEVPDVGLPSPGSFDKGTSQAQLQPLAQVPNLNARYFRPDYKANTATGQAISDVGSLFSEAGKLTDAVIQQNVDDTLHQGINNIRDSFGVAAAADKSGDVASAIGQAGAEGVSLVDDSGNPAPLAVNRMGNRIEGLTEAYRQGNLSNSAYWAKMEAFVRQTKQQYPGYGDIIDQKVSGIVGTTPANALRSSLLQDVSELQKKVQAGADKWTTYENSNSAYIHTLWPNYESLKAQGTAPSPAQVQQSVGNLKAQEWQNSATSAALAARAAAGKAAGDDAEAHALDIAQQEGQKIVIGATNSLGIHNMADMQKLLTQVQTGQRAPLSPDEKTQITGLFAQMEQQYNINVDNALSKPLAQGSPQSLKTLIRNGNTINDIKSQGRAQLDTLKDALINDKTGVLASVGNENKARQDAAENSLVKSAPYINALNTYRQKIGDQGLMFLAMKDPIILNSELQALREASMGFSASGKGSMVQTLSEWKNANPAYNDPNLVRKTLSDQVNRIANPERFADGEEGQRNSVKYLYGPNNRTLIDLFDGKNQSLVFQQVFSPAVTKAISKMDPESKKTYIQAAYDGFGSTYEQEVHVANVQASNIASNQNMKLSYDPSTNHFQYNYTGLLPQSIRGASVGLQNHANARLQGLNNAIDSMKHIFKMEGRDPTEALYTLLPVAGVDPGTPVYKALQDEMQKIEQKKIDEANPTK